MTPDLLNTAYDKLSTRLDMSVDEIPGANATISDWQDWYWTNLDAWNVNELPGFIDAYNGVANALDRAEQASGTLKAPYEDSQPAPGSSDVPEVLDEVLIKAKRPWWYWALWAAAAGIGIYTAKTVLFSSKKGT